MTQTFGLPQSTIEAIRTVLARHPQVEKAILYGSRAKGTYKHGSDIDLTLCGDGLTLAVQQQIMAELDDLLLPHMIDLSILSQIGDPEVVEHIRRVGVVFFQRPEGS